jgi:non-canonical purine NTP pyrophosphatase (RdgB/HAM1 family)
MITSKLTLIIASHNSNKVREFAQMLGDDFKLSPLTANDLEPIEDGSTYVENALIKARSASAAYPDDFVIADDSGIEIEALQNKPGIYSARYPNPNNNPTINSETTIAELSDNNNRRASYYCCIALIDPSGQEILFETKLLGHLLQEKRGENGFAYDFFFVPEIAEDDDRTLAEMSIQEKNLISHRGQAVDLLREYLSSLNN